MKRLNLKRYKWILMGCILSLAVGCTQDDVLTDNPSELSSNLLELSLSAGEKPLLLTRQLADQTEPGEDLLNENLVETIDILFFTKDTKELVWRVPEKNIKKGEGKLVISVPTEKATVMESQDFDMVSLANLPDEMRGRLDQVMERADLEELKLDNLLNKGEKQKSFVMTAEQETGEIHFTAGKPYPLGVVELKRVASKIRIRISEEITAEDGAEANKENMQIRLMSYAKDSYLMPGKLGEEKKISTDNVLLVKSENEQIYSTTLPYYAYENNWIDDDSKETFLLLTVEFTHQGSEGQSITTPYYYRINLSNKGDSSNRTSLQRNHLYNINVTIEKLGNESPSLPLDLEGSVYVEEWEELDDLDAELSKASFLVVKENDIIMANVADYTVGFLSSSEVSVNGKIEAVYYSYDVVTGKPTGPHNAEETPTVKINQAEKTFTINSKIPINYVPLEIKFTLKNQEGLTEIVHVTQYPPRYITAIVGPRPLHGHKKDPKYVYIGTENGLSSSHQNFTMFIVTTLVPEKDDIIGDPWNTTTSKTGDDAESNKLISPQFMIASQYGVTGLRRLKRDKDGESAETRCSKYFEGEYGLGKGYNGQWRLPTKAEIEYIQRLQKDSNSAVKNLLQGEMYWSAMPFYYYNFNNVGSWTSGNKYSKAHIRCVFDVYKYVKP